MPTNTAFGTLPSPTTQLLGGNAGGGVAGVAPEKKKPVVAQAGTAAGTAPTFAQLQQQGQARPAPQQPPAQGEASNATPPMLAQLSSNLKEPEQAPAEPWRGQVSQGFQQRMSDQTAQATPQSVALAMSKGDFGPRRSVNVAGRQITPGSVGMSGNQKVIYTEDGGMRPYTDADREAEVLEIQARGELPGSPEAAIREQLLNDPAYADVLVKVRGMLASASNQQAGPSRPSTTANQFQDELMQQLRAFGAQGTTDTPEMQQLRASRRADIEAEFGAKSSELNEEMARRGLSASSIGAGRYGDLAGQQARAITSMETELQSQAAKEAAENKRFYLQQMMGLSGQLSTGELEQSKLSLQERQVNADIDYRAKELQQEASLKGRELNLQEARDIASNEHQRGQLALGYADIGSKEKLSESELAARERMSSAEIGSRERMTQAEIGSREQMQKLGFTFEAGQSQLERDLRSQLQAGQITAEGQRQLNQIEANRALQTDAQTFQGAQSLLERQLREKMQTAELTATEKNQLKQIEASKSLQEGQQAWQAGETEKGNKFSAAQSQLDRDLRAQLSGDEIKAASERFNKQFGLDEKRFNADTAQNRNQFLATLAATLAPLDQKKRDEILIDLGIKPKVGGGVSGTTTGGGYGNDTGI